MLELYRSIPNLFARSPTSGSTLVEATIGFAVFGEDRDVYDAREFVLNAMVTNSFKMLFQAGLEESIAMIPGISNGLKKTLASESVDLGRIPNDSINARMASFVSISELMESLCGLSSLSGSAIYLVPHSTAISDIHKILYDLFLGDYCFDLARCLGCVDWAVQIVGSDEFTPVVITADHSTLLRVTETVCEEYKARLCLF